MNWWAERQLAAVAISVIQFSALAFMMLSFLTISQFAKADDNHVHIDQVNNGDDTSLTVTQQGYGNEVEFSFDHQSNTFNLEQYGSNIKISWVPYWDSGYSWGRNYRWCIQHFKYRTTRWGNRKLDMFGVTLMK